MQAATYLNAKDSTITKYLRIYEESSDNTIKLLSKDFEDIRRYPGMKNPVATTWLISFEQIQVRDPLAAEYMAFMSCIKEQYDMHRLVHMVMQNWLKLKDEWESRNHKTLKQITDIFPWPLHKNRAVWIMYLPHAQWTVATFNMGLRRTKETNKLLGRLLYNLGGCSQIQGKYAEAEAMYRQAAAPRDGAREGSP
jgi:hypothetical protein